MVQMDTNASDRDVNVNGERNTATDGMTKMHEARRFAAFAFIVSRKHKLFRTRRTFECYSYLPSAAMAARRDDNCPQRGLCVSLAEEVAPERIILPGRGRFHGR